MRVSLAKGTDYFIKIVTLYNHVPPKSSTGGNFIEKEAEFVGSNSLQIEVQE